MEIPAPRHIELHQWGLFPHDVIGIPRKARVHEGGAPFPHSPRKFVLRSVLHRRGDISGRSGHWWAHLLLGDDSWIMCNDEAVSVATDQGSLETACLSYIKMLLFPLRLRELLPLTRIVCPVMMKTHRKMQDIRRSFKAVSMWIGETTQSATCN